jgi:hypothetical protein
MGGIYHWSSFDLGKERTTGINSNIKELFALYIFI